MRRSFVVLLASLAVVAAACGSGRSNHRLERATGDSTTTSESSVPETTTTVIAASPGTAAPSSTAGTATPAPRRVTPTTRRATGGGSTPGGGTPAPAPGGTTNLAAVRARLTQVTSLQSPVALAVRANDPALYFAQKTGSVVAFRNGQVDPRAVLTVSVSTGSEQGLLGVTFSPDGSHIYVNFTDPAGDTHVQEFAMAGGYAAGAARELLFVDQPYANHNGGNLVFGPDGLLYIGLGDGGSGNDPENRAQNDGTLLGKMLRMNVATSQPPTIWAKGLRNPWRYSFDRATGSFWIGDVGQDAWEEVDFAPGVNAAGMNFGWPRWEGNHQNAAKPPVANPTGPIYEYSHSATGGCSITGGYVYRGSRNPPMNGVYLFGDFCAGHIMGLANGVRDLGMVVPNLSSFGQDLNGDLYALSLNGGVYRIDPA